MGSEKALHLRASSPAERWEDAGAQRVRESFERGRRFPDRRKPGRSDRNSGMSSAKPSGYSFSARPSRFLAGYAA